MCHMWCVTCDVSHVMCQVSRVRCHVSCVRCHVSGVMCKVSSVTFLFFLQSGGASWRRVCYQGGLPRLVYITPRILFHNLGGASLLKRSNLRIWTQSGGGWGRSCRYSMLYNITTRAKICIAVLYRVYGVNYTKSTQLEVQCIWSTLHKDYITGGAVYMKYITPRVHSWRCSVQ